MLHKVGQGLERETALILACTGGLNCMSMKVWFPTSRSHTQLWHDLRRLTRYEVRLRVLFCLLTLISELTWGTAPDSPLGNQSL